MCTKSGKAGGDHLLAPRPSSAHRSFLCVGPGGAQGGIKPGSGLMELMVQVGDADT